LAGGFAEALRAGCVCAGVMFWKSGGRAAALHNEFGALFWRGV
jgi:hypothetical protein